MSLTLSSSSSSPDDGSPPMPSISATDESASLVEQSSSQSSLTHQDSTQSLEMLEKYFIKQEKGVMTVLAMSVGLDNRSGGKFGDDGFEKDDRLPQQSKNKRSNKQKKWKPTQNTLVNEIKRRKKEYYPSNKGSSKMSKKKALDWLLAFESKGYRNLFS